MLYLDALNLRSFSLEQARNIWLAEIVPSIYYSHSAKIAA